MKKLIYLSAIIGLILSACNPMEQIEDELEEMNSGYVGTFDYELTSDDYGDIADLALAADPGDTLNAAFISSNEYFTDEVPAARYVPLLVPELYPALGRGSSGMITYHYSGELPEDLTMYTEADEYELAESDYSSLDDVVTYAGYYSPGYPPEVYVPSVLDSAMDAPEDGEMVLVEYLYSDVDPKIDMSSSSDVEVFFEGFTLEADGLGQFTATSVTGEQVWGWNEFGDGNARMSGYSGGAMPNEDWLITTDPVDLSGLSEASLHVNQAVNYLNDEWDQVKVYVSTDYNGSDIAGATWDEITIPESSRPSGSDWTFVESGALDLTSYAGQSIYIGFKYLSSDSNASTWEIADVAVTTPGSVAVIGKDPETYKDYYVFDEGEWVKASGVYYVNAVDYDAMGDPGRYNNFSGSDKPSDYIPGLLNAKFPLAGAETEIVVVYRYYAGTTLTLASTYTMNNGAWESSYDYVEPTSAQFLYGKTGWVFDPTVTFTMTSEDYQMIVDYVADNISGDYLDTYGTFESYFGAGSYYVNFDIRPGNFEAEEFDSWEDAVEAAIGTVLLPMKYPDAMTQVNGVDMYYVVNFDTYSGSAGSYTMKFQVTKSGPDPEFTLVEGP